MRKDQERLIAEMRRLHQDHYAPDDLIAPMAETSHAYDFRMHPAYDEINVLNAASRALNIPSPFYRRASAVEGARICLGDQWYDNYCSYDYIGLNQDPRIGKAVEHAVKEWGVSATASRTVGGERGYHIALEEAIAAFLGTKAALTFVSGHATNIAILRTLVDKNDVVFVDSLAHNSIYEGIVASGATHVTFPHNNMARLQVLLDETRSSFRNAIIATEGLFSMDGDLAPLPELVALKNRYDAWLVVDEAHALGVIGKSGRGVSEALGVGIDQIDVVMGTLSKSLCASGGFVAGSQSLIELLKCKAPGFVYSVGLSAPIAAAAHTALKLLSAEPDRVTLLHERSSYLHARLSKSGFDCATSAGYAVVPVILGDSILASRYSQELLASGICVAPIIAPAVPNKGARLRFFITADHTEAQLDNVVLALTALRDR